MNVGNKNEAGKVSQEPSRSGNREGEKEK